MRWLILIALLLPITTNGGSVASLQDDIMLVNKHVTEEQALQLAMAISKYSVAYNMDSRLIAAVIATESRFNTKAVGKSHGEIGLMQLRPEFHLTSVKNIKKRKIALFDIDTNIATGVRYLSGLREVFGNNYTGMGFIEHYNIGPNKKAKTFKYTAKVMKYYRMFGGTIVRPTLSQAF